MAGDKTSGPRTFGTVIRERRTELGLTQEELAERVGEHVRQSDISRLERDYVMLPRRDRLEALAAALEVTTGYLLLHSGWITSAEFAMIDAPRADHASADGGTMARPAEVERQDHVDPDGAPVGNASDAADSQNAVTDAVERARAVVRHTDEILRHSATTIQKARRSRGGTG